MIIDGRKKAEEIIEHLKREVSQLSFVPVFCDVLVGDDPVSLSYVNIKAKTAERAGIAFKFARFPDGITEQGLIEEIKGIQSTPNLCGLIVQLPLPAGMNRQAVLDSIDPELDVDCLGTMNAQNFYSNTLKNFTPPTAGAVMVLLEAARVDLMRSSIAVIGNGALVGRPVAHILKSRGYNLMVADRETRNLNSVTERADVIISGTGNPGLITGSMVKEGVVVIDAGTAEMDGGIVGDVDFASVEPKASLITPVPGGVGPVTVAQLLTNVVHNAKIRNSVQ